MTRIRLGLILLLVTATAAVGVPQASLADETVETTESNAPDAARSEATRTATDETTVADATNRTTTVSDAEATTEGDAGATGETPTTETTETPTSETTATTETPTTGTPTAAEIRADAVAATREVATYRVAASIERTISTARITRTFDVTSRGTFNRTAHRLRIDQTTRTPTRTVNTTTYVVNRSLYVRSDAFVQRYGSEWITADASNLSRRWRLLDTLARQRAILANASVDLLRTTSVNGTEAYVLRADVNETTFRRAMSSRFGARTVNVTNASFTFWIAAESRRILRSNGTVESETTLRGQPVTVIERLTLRFHAYDEPTSISLPEAASTAVRIGSETTTTDDGTTESRRVRPHAVAEG